MVGIGNGGGYMVRLELDMLGFGYGDYWVLWVSGMMVIG